MDRTLLSVSDVTKHYPVKRNGRSGPRRMLRAVDGVSLSIGTGETVGLVGESGSGKSTLGRIIVGLTSPTGGDVTFHDGQMPRRSPTAGHTVRTEIQMVFQDPYSSLDPRMTILDSVAEPLRANGRWSRSTGPATVAELLDRVGISPRLADRYPREFSGGQRQRVGIARALALEPRLIVLDEPVSALDVSVQAQVLNLLQDLQDEFGMSYLFISHDLSVVRHIADRVAVMHLGRVVELADSQSLYSSPAHPYTKALLSAVPRLRPHEEGRRDRVRLTGTAPSPIDPPSGCSFRTRCWQANGTCSVEPPMLTPVGGPDHSVACFVPLGRVTESTGAGALTAE